MKKHAFLFVMLFTLAFYSCNSNKQESKESNDIKQEQVEVKPDTVATMAETEKVVESISLLGTWNGVFDQRKTTLKITNQNGNEFEGSITINYREVINQKVKGSFDSETKTFIMSDQLHSRYAGTYTGKISDDLNSLSGTFTQNVDKTKFSFNFKK
ncbi:MAG: hypothetical protein Fur0015_12250 [Ignavibacteriales bacterium]